jgi:RNA polymerase sigma-70 factor (ECF subfamily)
VTTGHGLGARNSLKWSVPNAPPDASRAESAESAEPDALAQLSELLLRERAELVAVAVHQGLSAEEALECLQDALCRWLSRAAAQPLAATATLSMTLKAMVKNAARNRRRRHHRLRPHLPLDVDRGLESPQRDAEQLLSAAETSLRLKLCVAELREVERAVVTLRLLDERSGEDVAQTLGLSRAHVDVLVHRAKATLRVCMHADDCAFST